MPIDLRWMEKSLSRGGRLAIAFHVVSHKISHQMQVAQLEGEVLTYIGKNGVC